MLPLLTGKRLASVSERAAFEQASFMVTWTLSLRVDETQMQYSLKHFNRK